jgi:hypothetical protein
MTVAELETIFRSTSRDHSAPYNLSPSEFLRLLNEAEQEACERKNLIYDSSTSAVCQVAVVADDRILNTHAKILEVAKAYLVSGTDYYYMNNVDQIEMDRVDPSWRETTDTPTRYIVWEDTIELNYASDASYTMYLEVYRLPLTDMTAYTSSPEIATVHHLYLLDWVYSRYYDIRKEEIYSPDLVAEHERRFTAYFGLKPTADRKRGQWTNRPQHNKVWV